MLPKNGRKRPFYQCFRGEVQIAIFRGQQGRISRPDRAILNGQF